VSLIVDIVAQCVSWHVNAAIAQRTCSAVDGRCLLSGAAHLSIEFMFHVTTHTLFGAHFTHNQLPPWSDSSARTSTSFRIRPDVSWLYWHIAPNFTKGSKI